LTANQVTAANVQIETQTSSENNNIGSSPDEGTTQATTPSMATGGQTT